MDEGHAVDVLRQAKWRDLAAERDRLRALLREFVERETCARCEVKGGFCYAHLCDEPCLAARAKQALEDQP